MATRRLRGPHALIHRSDAHARRLVIVSDKTFKWLVGRATEVSRKVGFVVYPLQVAALLLESHAGER